MQHHRKPGSVYLGEYGEASPARQPAWDQNIWNRQKYCGIQRWIEYDSQYGSEQWLISWKWIRWERHLLCFTTLWDLCKSLGIWLSCPACEIDPITQRLHTHTKSFSKLISSLPLCACHLYGPIFILKVSLFELMNIKNILITFLVLKCVSMHFNYISFNFFSQCIFKKKKRLYFQ